MASVGALWAKVDRKRPNSFNRSAEAVSRNKEWRAVSSAPLYLVGIRLLDVLQGWRVEISCWHGRKDFSTGSTGFTSFCGMTSGFAAKMVGRLDGRSSQADSF